MTFALNRMEKRSFWLSIWVWWAALTILYLAIFTGSGVKSNYIRFITAPLIGLFVPIGFGNFIGSINQNGYGPEKIKNGWIIIFPLLLLTLYIADKIAKKFAFNIILRIFYNLAILFILTLVVDIILWHRWLSFYWLNDAIFQIFNS